jgi:hypothetical protein
MHTRREFMERVGITLVSLLMTRCVLPGRQDDSPRGRLRACWLRFDWLAERAVDMGNYERGQQAMEELVADHRSALDELVAAGELERDVAGQVQTAYNAAAYHVWRANAPITCYEAVMIDYVPASSAQLARQAATLTEMAERGDLDPDVVAQARAAIERDVAFLNYPSEAIEALYREISAHMDESGVPQFEDLDLEVTPAAAQAAQYLVDLLLANEG